MLRSLIVLAFCAWPMLAPANAALAQSGRPKPAQAREPAEYKEAIATAISEFERNNYEEAREHFARAHSLSPNARTLRGMGMTEFELKNYLDAVSYLEQALSSEVRPLEARLRDETSALLASAKHYVGSVRLDLDPPTSTVRVDGIPMKLDEQSSLRLVVGDHLLEFRAEGRLSERRAIKTRGEQVLELSVHLAQPNAEPLAEAPAPLAPAATPLAESTPVYKRWWLWTAVGALAAGGAVAAVLLTRKVEHPEEPRTTPNTPPNGSIQLLSRP